MTNLPVLSGNGEKSNPLITFTYKNYKGVVSKRTAVAHQLYWGSNEYHKEPQWLIEAYDAEKKAIRHFALSDMSDIVQLQIDAPEIRLMIKDHFNK